MNPVLQAVMQNLERPWVAAVLLMIGASAFRKTAEDKRSDFLTALGFVALTGISLPLHLLLIRTRGSIDPFLLRADAAVGFNHAALYSFVFAHQFLWSVLKFSYNIMPLALALLWVVQRDSTFRKSVLIGSLACWPLYALFPAAGPLYYFEHIQMDSPRNAMPSMHMFFALAILLNAKGWTARLCASGFVLLTIGATLGSGEHYLIDLVAAVPFTFTVQYLASLNREQAESVSRTESALQVVGSSNVGCSA